MAQDQPFASGKKELRLHSLPLNQRAAPMTSIPPNHPYAIYCSQSADAAFQAIRILGPHMDSDGLLIITGDDGQISSGSARRVALESSLSKLLNMNSIPLGKIIHALELIRAAFKHAPEQIRHLVTPSQNELLEPYCQSLFRHFHTGILGGLPTLEHQRRLDQVRADLAEIQRP